MKPGIKSRKMLVKFLRQKCDIFGLKGESAESPNPLNCGQLGLVDSVEEQFSKSLAGSRFRIPFPHTMASLNLYPIPQTVSTYFGLFGFTSILILSRLTCGSMFRR